MDSEKHEPRFTGTVSEQRHNNMSRIKGKDTKIEIQLRKALWAKGNKYRKISNCFRTDLILY